MKGELRRSRFRILPLGSRGSSSTNVNAAGHLKSASFERTCAASSASVTVRPCLDDGGEDLAVALVGDAEHRGVDHGGVQVQHVFDLAGVDVDAVAEHHVGHAVGDVQVAVVVETTDVADGEGVAAPRRLGLGVVGDSGTSRRRRA